MEYQVLIKLFVPDIESEFELYIPINITIMEVIIIINKMLHEKTNEIYPITENLELYNRRTGETYKNNNIIHETNIRNGTELLLILIPTSSI